MKKNKDKNQENKIKCEKEKAQSLKENPLIKGFVVPGLPHILLCPQQNKGWSKIRQVYENIAKEIDQSEADLLVIYSTYWPSILGHQIQAYPHPEFVHVDDEFHALGSMSYRFYIDSSFAEVYRQRCQEKGLSAQTVSYQGFPIDTGSVVALKLLNPINRLPAVIVSSHIYADRSETVVLGKACREALEMEKRKAVAIAITSLSNRIVIHENYPTEDEIASRKDDEWNRKFLDFLQAGRLEDVSQLSRQFHREARVPKVNNFKPIWWLSAVMGQNNCYLGQVYEYQSIVGTGAALVGLTPTLQPAKDLEFDEEDPSIYTGEREVIGRFEVNSHE